MPVFRNTLPTRFVVGLTLASRFLLCSPILDATASATLLCHCIIFIMPNTYTSFDVACHSASRSIERTSDCTASPATAANLLSPDSVFYQPTRWKSWYMKKLTCDLSITRYRASKQRLLPSTTAAVATSHCQYRIEPQFSQSGNSPHATRSQAKPDFKKPHSTMIKAMHQFSTIKTVYSDDRKSFVSQVNPLRAMLVQVDFEVYGEVSGMCAFAYDML